MFRNWTRDIQELGYGCSGTGIGMLRYTRMMFSDRNNHINQKLGHGCSGTGIWMFRNWDREIQELG